MALISWNQVLLYPKGWKSDDLTYVATLKLPTRWKFGTPLPIASTTGDNGATQITFQPASLTTLVDSPVITGEFLKVVKLADDPLTEMDIAADSAAALAPPQEVWDHYKNLVEQANKLFGAHHYRDYHFLLSLSDHVAHFGLEHHESDDSRAQNGSQPAPSRIRAFVERKIPASCRPHHA
jgi:predicted metalloprotease with PDZ domain